MDPSLILPYLWVILVLVFLEGLLAADNAVVMAVMVNIYHLNNVKALFYGLLGAFVFRFLALFLMVLSQISGLSSTWCRVFNFYVNKKSLAILPQRT